jgi:predicted extracellular nuclease
MATALTVGDLTLIGFSSDTAGKSFAFVLLRDIEAGTQISFTDHGWRANGGFRANEGVVSYTAPAGGASAGTVITVAGLTGQLNPNVDGDQFIAFQGTVANPSPLFALDFADSNDAYAADATNSNTSAVPTGLTFGVTALAFGADNGAYTGPTTGSRAELLSAIATASNWTLNDTAPQPYAASFTLQGGDPGPRLPTLSVSDATVSEADGTIAFTVSLSAASAETVTATYATADGTATAGSDYTQTSGKVSFAPGATTATIVVPIANDAAAGEGDETFALTLSNPSSATLADAQAIGTIRDDDIQVTRISEVQGSGGVSPLANRTATIEAIVVGDFQNGDADGRRNLGGFYLQEEAGDQDGNALTSEGLFVFEGSGALRANVNEGDRVRVTGTVTEFNGETQLSVTSASAIEVVAPGAVADVGALAAVLALPTAGVIGSVTAGYQPDLEAYEGMLVTIPQTLTVTEQFNLDRFNEIELYASEGDGLGGAIDESADGRPYQFTQTNHPDAAGYAAHLQQVGARTITYDDGLNSQNQPIDNLDGFDPDDDGIGVSTANPAEPGYTTATAPRMGDTITGLTGVLGFGPANTYRVRAVEDGDNSFAPTNPRPAEPEDVGGTLKVASFNVLNYFTTLNAGGATTANGFEPRGANSAAEFERQTDKLVTAILGLDADVLGLVELENNFIEGSSGNAVAYLVDELNAAVGEVRYDWIRPGQDFVGGDAIAVGFIYKPSEVRVAMNTTIEILDDTDAAAAALVPQSTVGGIFNGENTSRAALAVTFEEIASGETFTAVANHFKSKSGNGTGEDADQRDGAGAWDNQRELAAEALTDWLGTNPTGTDDGDVLVLGDLNAYFQENPIDLLKAAGFENLQETRLENPYSYVFDGQVGSLDYILTNESLSRQVTGITEWHINADEADALDYNLDFGRNPYYFDGDVAARVSDHDPLLVGLDLGTAARSLAGTNKADDFTDIAGSATTFSAGNGDDVVRGLDGADILFGGNGEDSLYGGSGRDRLSGDNGSDWLVGGAGADVFVFARGGGRDTVVDFNLGEGDRLEIADGMRLVSLREVDTDGSGGVDATELRFNGVEIRLAGVTGLASTDGLFA